MISYYRRVCSRGLGVDFAFVLSRFAILPGFRSDSVTLRSMSLDLSSTEGAIKTLERSVKSAAFHVASIPRELQQTVRSGVMQNFEVAYELSWKLIKRWL